MRFACPKCDSRLRLPETFVGERRVTCPHCRCDFPLAGDEGEARNNAVDRSSSLRRAYAPDEQRGSFRPRKRHKARKSMNPLLIVIPVVAGVTVFVGSVWLAVVYVRSRPKDEVVAAAPTDPSPPETPIQNTPIPNNPGNSFAPVVTSGEPVRPPVGQQPSAEPPKESPGPPPPPNNQPPPANPPPAPIPDRKLAVPGTEFGNIAPEIVGNDLDGHRFRLSDYHGKVVVLDFWGHW